MRFHPHFFLFAAFYFLTVHSGEARCQLRMNDIQLLGTHNSYKKPVDQFFEDLFGDLQSADSTAFTINDISYGHPTLREQLEKKGVRHMELDIYDDPIGGRYADFHFMNMFCPDRRPEIAELYLPGFKVMHDANFDFHSQCYLFTECLKNISDWSKENPDHLPVTIFLEIKYRMFSIPYEDISKLMSLLELPVPLPVSDDIYQRIQEEILQVFSKEQIITPESVKGSYATINEAVRSGNWPLLQNARGKIAFMVQEIGSARHHYLSNLDQSIGQLMFFNLYSMDDEQAAFLTFGNPASSFESIQEAVRAGFIVRTRADADAREAYAGDYSRSEFALRSGAQLVQTDYLNPDPRTQNGYFVSMPQGNPGRCNPVRSAPSNCTPAEIAETQTGDKI